MRFLSLKPVTKPCTCCGRSYFSNVGKTFNPLGYLPGLCIDCNQDVLDGILKKGHCIFKNDYINNIDKKYFKNN